MINRKPPCEVYKNFYTEINATQNRGGTQRSLFLIGDLRLLEWRVLQSHSSCMDATKAQRNRLKALRLESHKSVNIVCGYTVKIYHGLRIRRNEIRCERRLVQYRQIIDKQILSQKRCYHRSRCLDHVPSNNPSSSSCQSNSKSRRI